MGKVINNSIIPFGKFKAVNLFGFIFTKGNLSDYGLNHENIHTAQIKEMWYIFFYIFYVIEFIYRLFTSFTPYLSLSFEQEAYQNQDNLDYLKTRKPYAWLQYLLINKDSNNED